MQVRPHIAQRNSMPWSRPAARLGKLESAIRDAWDGNAPFNFRGEFYAHTLMPPSFNPGRALFERPRLLFGGVGPHLTRVTAEVGNGIHVHPLTTRESLEQITLPALDYGLHTAGRDRSELDVTVVTMIATGETGPSSTRPSPP